MAKLYFYYGAMGSSKSMNLLMAAHNYESQGKSVLVFTSGIDTRAGKNLIKSRVGPFRVARPVFDSTNIFYKVKEYIETDNDLYAILLDEVQFYTQAHISQLSDIVDDLGIPVLAYGLKTDFTGKLFEGAQALLEQADRIDEIKTICTFCNKKATHNLRTIDKHPIFHGEQIQIGDDEYYPVCRKHHKRPILDNNEHIKVLSPRIDSDGRTPVKGLLEDA